MTWAKVVQAYNQLVKVENEFSQEALKFLDRVDEGLTNYGYALDLNAISAGLETITRAISEIKGKEEAPA